MANPEKPGPSKAGIAEVLAGREPVLRDLALWVP